MNKRETREALERYQNQLQHIIAHARTDVSQDKQSRDERVKRAKHDYNFMVRHYFPHWAKADCAPFHISEANRIRKDKDIAALLEWARGLAKSTHVDVFIPIWLHLFWGEELCMVLVGKNLDAAKVLLSDLLPLNWTAVK